MRVILLLLFLFPELLYGQINETVTPYTGMAGTDNALFSPWTIFSNPGGISRIERVAVGTSYKHIFDLKELGIKTFLVAVPSYWGTFGATFSYFGYDKYNEKEVGIAYGKQLTEWLDLGIKAKYRHIHIAKQSSRKEVWYAEGGAVFSFRYGLKGGVNISNPFGFSENVPELYALGISWKVDPLFLFAAKAEEIDNVFFLSLGVEFSYRHFLSVRCGVKSKYNHFYTGVSVKPDTFEISLSYKTDERLGNTLGILVGWYMKRGWIGKKRQDIP